MAFVCLGAAAENLRAIKLSSVLSTPPTQTWVTQYPLLHAEGGRLHYTLSTLRAVTQAVSLRHLISQLPPLHSDSRAHLCDAPILPSPCPPLFRGTRLSLTWEAPPTRYSFHVLHDAGNSGPEATDCSGYS